MLASGFTPVTVQFSALEKNRKGGKVVFLGLPGADGQRQKILLQTPTMALPFGVSPYQDAATGEIQSYSLDASFRGSDTDPRIGDFLTRMRELDEVTLDVAVANSKDWFGKPMSKEIVSEFHRKLVKDPINPQYSPVIKFKVQLQNGQPNAMFFDEKRQPCDIDYFTKGTTFKVTMPGISLIIFWVTFSHTTVPCLPWCRASSSSTASGSSTRTLGARGAWCRPWWSAAPAAWTALRSRPTTRTWPTLPPRPRLPRSWRTSLPAISSQALVMRTCDVTCRCNDNFRSNLNPRSVFRKPENPYPLVTNSSIVFRSFWYPGSSSGSPTLCSCLAISAASAARATTSLGFFMALRRCRRCA